MRTYTRFIATALAAVALVATAPLFAHDQLFPGTVMAVEAAKIRVNTIDAKTRKETPMWFEVADDTKVKRGDLLVTYAGAKIVEGERIVVVVNHDDGRTAATELRLAAVKEATRYGPGTPPHLSLGHVDSAAGHSSPARVRGPGNLRIRQARQVPWGLTDVIDPVGMEPASRW